MKSWVATCTNCHAASQHRVHYVKDTTKRELNEHITFCGIPQLKQLILRDKESWTQKCGTTFFFVKQRVGTLKSYHIFGSRLLCHTVQLILQVFFYAQMLHLCTPISSFRASKIERVKSSRRAN